LYNDPMEESLAEALRQFLLKESFFNREVLQQSVLRFSRARFADAISEQVTKLMEDTRRGMISE